MNVPMIAGTIKPLNVYINENTRDFSTATPIARKRDIATASLTPTPPSEMGSKEESAINGTATMMTSKGVLEMPNDFNIKNAEKLKNIHIRAEKQREDR